MSEKKAKRNTIVTASYTHISFCRPTTTRRSFFFFSNRTREGISAERCNITLHYRCLCRWHRPCGGTRFILLSDGRRTRQNLGQTHQPPACFPVRFVSFLPLSMLCLLPERGIPKSVGRDLAQSVFAAQTWGSWWPVWRSVASRLNPFNTPSRQTAPCWAPAASSEKTP